MAENEPTVVGTDGIADGHNTAVQDTPETGSRSDPGPDLAQDVAKLRAALQAERKLKREAESRLAEFADISPDEAREALKSAAKAREAQDRTKDRVEKDNEARLSQIEAKHEKESGSWKKREEFLLGQIQRNLVDSAVSAAIAEAGANVALLSPHVKAAIKLDTDKDGNYAVRVAGEDGEPLVTLESGKTGDMSVREYVDTVMREKFPMAFPGTGNSGTGATGSDRSVISGGAVRISSKDARDARKYREAKTKAEKHGLQFIVEQDELR